MNPMAPRAEGKGRPKVGKVSSLRNLGMEVKVFSSNLLYVSVKGTNHKNHFNIVIKNIVT